MNEEYITLIVSASDLIILGKYFWILTDLSINALLAGDSESIYSETY